MAEAIYYYDTIDVKDSRLNKFRRIIMSGFMLLTAYLLANMLHQLIVGALCMLLGYDTHIGFHYVTAAPYEYRFWNGSRVLFIYFTPPFICLGLSYVIQFTILQKAETINRLRLFFFWVQMSLINVFLTQLLIIPLGTSPRYATGFYQTFSIVATWFKIPAGFFIVTTIIAATLAIVVGYLAAPEIQRYSFSSRLVQTQDGKNKIAAQVYLLPVLMAVPAIIWFSNTWSFLVHVVLISLFILPWLGIYIRHRKDMSIVRCSKADVLNHWPIVEALITIVVWALAVFFFDR